MNTEKPIIAHEAIITNYEDVFMFLLRILNLILHYRKVEGFIGSIGVNFNSYDDFKIFKTSLLLSQPANRAIHCRVEVWG